MSAALADAACVQSARGCWRGQPGEADLRCLSGETPRQTVFPDVKYLRPRAALEFLSVAFGFEEHCVVAGADGEVEHAEIRAGNDLIFISRSRDGDRYGMQSPLVLGGTSHGVCIWVPDSELDEHRARAHAAGATILNPIHDAAAGVREYCCADREGQVWTFSSYTGQ
ncbi:VOC family protein [Nocardia sp. NPDC051321]|uniref:VOC family protein n=1 Tax=Nocardia sp. NPDC051321 TaxID=3364323 RepID=UPI00378C1C2D